MIECLPRTSVVSGAKRLRRPGRYSHLAQYLAPPAMAGGTLTLPRALRAHDHGDAVPDE